MRTSELVKEIALEHNLTQKESKKIVNSIVKIITRELLNGERVKLNNLGSFYTTQYRQHRIIPVNTDELVTLEGRTSPRFTPSRKLREKLKDNH